MTSREFAANYCLSYSEVLAQIYRWENVPVDFDCNVYVSQTTSKLSSAIIAVAKPYFHSCITAKR